MNRKKSQLSTPADEFASEEQESDDQQLMGTDVLEEHLKPDDLIKLRKVRRQHKFAGHLITTDPTKKPANPRSFHEVPPLLIKEVQQLALNKTERTESVPENIERDNKSEACHSIAHTQAPTPPKDDGFKKLEDESQATEKTFKHEPPLQSVGAVRLDDKQNISEKSHMTKVTHVEKEIMDQVADNIIKSDQ